MWVVECVCVGRGICVKCVYVCECVCRCVCMYVCMSVGSGVREEGNGMVWR